jgi:hypothetical protein
MILSYDAHTTRHRTTRHFTARHLTTCHFSTRHSDNSPLWQLATLTTRHLTTRHYDNLPPWQLVTMAYMPGSVSLFWLFFTVLLYCCTAPRIFHSIFCRFFVLINEIQHLLLHFNYVIFIYIYINSNFVLAKCNGGKMYWWRDVRVARCKGGEM